jgi:putative addiction module component (TIGR02574 family)
MIRPIKELEKLPLHERLQLVEDLWDSIAKDEADVSVPQWQIDEVKRRAELFDKNPDSGVPWEEAKELIRGSRG